MNSRLPQRNALLGIALDGSGVGPKSQDGQTRITKGPDYLLFGGTEETHGHLQDVAETLADACRDEGTSIGQAPPELIRDILSDLAED